MPRISELHRRSISALQRKRRPDATNSRSRKHSKTVESLEARQMLAADLVISEFLTLNTNGPLDNYGVRSDWIEIRNVTSDPINLAGLAPDRQSGSAHPVDVSFSDVGRGRLPDGLGLTRGDSNAGQPLHTSFKLDTDGECLGLIRPGLTVADQYSPKYPDQSANISYGRSTSLTTEGYFPTPTFGTANTVDPVPDPAQQIFISEIMYHPAQSRARAAECGSTIRSPTSGLKSRTAARKA